MKICIPLSIIDLFFYDIMNSRQNLRPCIGYFVAISRPVRTPSIEYELCVWDELLRATHCCTVSGSSLHPKLSFIAWRTLTNFITQIPNNIECVLPYLGFLLLNYCGLERHLSFLLGEANQNRFDRYKLSILLDLLPSDNTMVTLHTYLKL